MHRDAKLTWPLAILRLSLAAFLLVWSVDKIFNPKGAQAIFENFYFWKGAPAQTLLIFGIVQTLVIIVFALGLVKVWSYGAVIAMHLFATLASWSKMIPPYGPGANKLFWASVPVLAAMILLFLMRDRDVVLSLGHRHDNADKH